MIAIAARAAFGFLKGLPWQIYAALAALVLAWGVNHTVSKAIADARAAGLREGAAATAKLFNDAQAEADRLATIGVKVVTRKQDKISEEKSDALYKTHDAIDARSRAIGLRHSRAARERAGRSTDHAAAGEAASQPCPATPSDGLPWDVALPLMTQAAKDLAQLNAVLDWEEDQDRLAAMPVPLFGQDKDASIANPETK